MYKYTGGGGIMDLAWQPTKNATGASLSALAIAQGDKRLAVLDLGAALR